MTAKRYRILFLLPSLAGGGAERSALNLLTLLNRDDYDGYLAVGRAEGPLLEEFPDDVEIVEFLPRGCNLLKWLPLPAGKGILTAAVQLAKIIHRLKPDVILSFMPETSMPTALVKCFYRQHSFRWIVWEANATHRRLEYVITHKTKRWMLTKFIQMAYAGADHVVAISAGVKRGLIEHFKVSPTKVAIIYCPVNVAHVQKKANELIPIPWPEERVILGVGKLMKQKGFDVLIRAFAKMPRTISAKLIILGNGEQKKALETLAQRLGVSDHVIFPGFVSNPWSFMARADLFVLSSQWEGFGIVIVDAMACGTPVVATDCDYGPGEIISQGKDGILVRVGDVEGLAENMCKVLENREMAESLKQEGYRRAVDFDSKKICVQHEDVFKRVVECAVR